MTRYFVLMMFVAAATFGCTQETQNQLGRAVQN